ncbi:hypothetical protein GCM10010191_69370 [Actinomadura vinacea]|uniref:HEAT repeat domain-containing protein n=1 Tax=Actinomadura vinacea TaxID=115336 RepID=A0ABP5X2X7_9ACTN
MEISVGAPWTAEDLVASSDWLQRAAAQKVTSRNALAVLATKGRTRRVRNAAARGLAQLDD